MSRPPPWCGRRLEGMPYVVAEPVEALRLVLLQRADPDARHRANDSWASAELTSMSRFARKHDAPAVALRIVASSRAVTALPQEAESRRLLAKAKAAWCTGAQHAAIAMLQNVASPPPDVALQYAIWMQKAEGVPSATLINEWLPSLVQCGGRVGARASIHLALAADAVFRGYCDRASSTEMAGYREYLHAARAAQDELRKQLAANETRLSEAEKRQVISRLNATERDFRREEEEKQKFAVSWAEVRAAALNAYAAYLVNAPCPAKHDVHAAFRLAALWFSPFTAEIADRCNRASKTMVDVLPVDVRAALERIPTSKLLPVFPQLVVRIGTPVEPVTDAALAALIVRVAAEHPQQCVWPLLALANGGRYSDGEKSVHASDSTKIEAARQLLHKLQRVPAVVPVLTQMVTLAEAYLELAFQPTDKKERAKSFKLGPAAKLLAARNLTRVVVPTAAPGSTATVQEFRAIFDLVGGVNAPKVLYCIASDGEVMRQLIKSRDDLRQDAIIEQFFGVCNTQLQRDPETHRRQLQIRTYKVIPLAPTSGVVEWVEETTTLSDYLVGADGGAHKRWYPNDAANEDCRDRLHQVPPTSVSGKVAAFKAICSEFTPAMHFFFFEHYATADKAHHRRQQYVRSAAACSMLGYLVGLGDRHASNILIDKRNADLVHIDLGLAFEQGTALPVPERIPFRLTRDIVDGMGILGVEGPFRAQCEAVLAAMRQSQQLLATVLEAFLHDPLAKWAVVVPQDGASATNRTAGRQRQGGLDAERALARARDKLRGFEGGELYGVAGHVRKLIQTATDEAILAQLFPGWSAWV
jgi:ataxia telangiectasia mutated family protein